MRVNAQEKPRAGRAPRHKVHRERPEDEPADVGEERHAAPGLGLHDRVAPRPQLEEEPESEVEKGRDLDRQPAEERQDAAVG